jgi:restriction system protein
MEVELTPATRDGGKDILAYMDTPVGKLLSLVETKQHNKNRPVGVSLVRSLYGTVVDHQASSGMLVTTSRFAKPAKQFQEKHRYQLELKDYGDVVNWLLKHKT